MFCDKLGNRILSNDTDKGPSSMFIEQMNIFNFYFEPGYMLGGRVYKSEWCMNLSLQEFVVCLLLEMLRNMKVISFFSTQTVRC